MSKLDLSYKKRATKVEYDIESLETIFSIVFIHDRAVTTVFFGDSQYDDMLSDEEIAQISKDYMSNDEHRISFPDVESADDFDYHVLRVRTGDKDSMFAFNRLLMKFISCKPLATDDGYGFSFVEYCGWNSSRYDLPMMILTRMLIDELGDKLTPRNIRTISDLIIEYEGTPWRFAEFIEERTSGWVKLEANKYRALLNSALYADGHIDWARVAKLSDDGEDNKFPPGLKKEMARFGLDIVVDDLVAGEGGRHITRDELYDLLYYNVNDVYGTRRVGFNATIRAWLETRDIIHEAYNYTSAKSIDFSRVSRSKIPERDSTAANLAGNVLIGPKKIKPVDNDVVNYYFPVPDNRPEREGTRRVDLLEYMKETEAYMHPYIYEFFNHFRGKDTRRGYDLYVVSKDQPITHSATMNCPYYRDGKPLDAYIRVSTGGAHGSVMAGLSNKSPDEVMRWIESDVGALDSEKPTIDAKNVLHLDWSSFYPVMASKLKLYETAEGVDRYSNIIETRIKIKESLPYDHAEWTQQHYEDQELQIGLKFILNNATGAGNTHNKYAILPLDNKTLSMRLIGNMLIWCLAQRLSQEGAYVVSTNTDGIYVIGISEERTNEVVREYVHDYGMDVEPEIVSRFINRDTSNRIEIINGNIQEVRGRLRHGHHMKYTDDAIGKNVPYPIVTAHAALKYIADDEDWLNKPYDKEKMRKIVYDLHEQSTDPEAWFQIHVGSGSTRLTLDGIRQSKINRVVMTLPEYGKRIATERKAQLKKDECMEAWNFLCDNPGASMQDLAEVLGVVFTDETLALNVDTIGFGKKIEDETDKHKKLDVLVDSVPRPSEFDDADDFSDYWKGSLATMLVARDSDGNWQGLKCWREGALTGYTTDHGQILNKSSELAEFDMSTLDVDAYLAWAEKLLDGWKVTADIPEIGLESIDDTVVPKTRKKKKTKKMKNLELVRWLYEASDEEAAEV